MMFAPGSGVARDVITISIRLIKKDLLTEEEKLWINNYHMQVREIVKEHLSDFEISWLLKATAAI